jgi:predicted DNA-binding transcriptional regulator AlpA
MWKKKVQLPEARDDHALVRESVVLSMVPFGRSELRGRVKKGTFPAPVRVKTAGGKVIIAWPLAEIRQFNLDLVRQRDQAIAAERAADAE